MPELGKYAGAVLGSYALGLVLILALVGLSLWRSRRVAAQLRAAEARVKGQRDG